MADTSSRIRIIFDGAVEGLRRAVRAAERDLDRLSSALDRHRAGVDAFQRTGDRLGATVSTMVGSFLRLGAASSAIQGLVVAGATLASVTAQLAPAALALPGIFLGVAAAAGTLKLGLSGVADAFKEGKAGAEAFAKLSSEAKKFVTAVKGLDPAFQQLRRSVQDSLFRGLAVEVKTTGAELLKLGRQHLPAVAAGFNAMAAAAIRVARTSTFTGALAKIIDNTAKALGNAEGSLAAFLHGFVRLGEVGSKFLPAIGAAIDRVALKFNAWADEGVDSGRIEAMIDRAIQGFRDLGAVIGNLASAGRTAFDAFNAGLGGSGGTIESLKAATQALKDFANEPTTQVALTALGETVRVLSDTFRNVLLTALRELGPIIIEIAPFVQELARQLGTFLKGAIETVGPLLRDLARFLSEHKDIVVPLALALIPLAAAFKAVGLAVSTIRGVQAFAAGLRLIRDTVAGFPAGGLTAIGVGLAAIVAVEAARWAGDWVKGLGDVANAVPPAQRSVDQMLTTVSTGGLGSALQGVPAIFANYKKQFEEVQQFWGIDLDGAFSNLGASISTAFSGIGDSFQRDFVDVLTNAGTTVVDFFVNLPATIGGALSSFGSSIAQFAQPVVDFFVNLPATIGGALSSLGSFFAQKASEIWQAFLGGLQSAFGPVLAFFSQSPFEMGFAIGAAIGDFIRVAIDLWNNFLTGCQQGIQVVLAFCASVPTQIAQVVTGLVAVLVGVAVTAWNGFLTTTTNLVNTVVSFCASLPGRISSAISAIVSFVVNTAQNAWNGFLTATTSLVNSALSFIQSIPGRVSSFLSSLVSTVTRVATDTWNGFRNATTSGANATLDFIRSIPGRIAGFFSNAGSLLVNAGRAIIDGLLAGIKAGVQAMYDFVSGIAAGIAARKGPIEKDRKLLVPAGLAIMQSLQAGLASGAQRVFSFVSGLAPQMADLLNAGAAGASFDLAGFETASIARAQQAASQRLQLGDLVTQLTAQGQQAPQVNVQVFVGNEPIDARVEVGMDARNREIARLVSAGVGASF